MRGIEIFQKPSYREIRPMRDRPMRDRPMRGTPVPKFMVNTFIKYPKKVFGPRRPLIQKNF